MKQHFRLLVCASVIILSLPAARAALIGNDFNGTLYDVNLLTGAATNSRSTGIANLAGIAFSPSGQMFGLSVQPLSTALYSINPATGASTLIGSAPVSNQFTDQFSEGDLRFIGSHLYGLDYLAFQGGVAPVHQLFAINSTTGAIFTRTNLPCFNNPCVVDYSAIAANGHGQVYVLDTASLDPFGHLAVLSDTTLTSVGNVFLSGPLGTVAGMDIDPATGILYVADGGTSSGHLFTLDPTTGVLTTVGNLGVSSGLAGLAFAPSVPEPASGLLLGVALLALGLIRYRKLIRPAVPRTRTK